MNSSELQSEKPKKTLRDIWQAVSSHAALSVPCAFICALSYGIFWPLLIFENKFQSYIGGIREVIPYMLLFTAVGFLILLIVLSVIGVYLERFFYPAFIAVVVFSLLPAVQGAWMPESVAQIIDWKTVDFTGIGGYMLMDSILTIVILGIIAYELFKHPEFKKHYIRGMIAIAVLLIVLTGVKLSRVYRTYFGLSTSNLLLLSPDSDNLILLLTNYNGADGIGSRIHNAKLTEDMKGYTLYNDTAGITDNGNTNLFELLTGNRPDPNAVPEEYVEEAYLSSPVMHAMKDRKFRTYYFSTTASMPAWLPQDQYYNYEELSYSVKGEYPELLSAIYTHSFFYSTPFLFRNHISSDVPTFYSLLGKNEIPATLATLKTTLNNRRLRAHKSTDTPVCQIIYVDKFDNADELINFMLRLNLKLEKRGLYDATTVIAASVNGINPLLLVKEKNSSDPFRISYAPVSLSEDYLPAVLHALTGGQRGNAFSSINDQRRRTRSFYRIETDESSDEITGALTEVAYPYEEEVLKGSRILGMKLDTGNSEDEIPDTISRFSGGGFARSEEGVLVSNNQYSRFWFPLGKQEKDTFEFTIWFEDSTRKDLKIILSAGDTVIEEFTVAGKCKRQFTIPGDCVGEDGSLSILLYFPDYVHPGAFLTAEAFEEETRDKSGEEENAEEDVKGVAEKEPIDPLEGLYTAVSISGIMLK